MAPGPVAFRTFSELDDLGEGERGAALTELAARAPEVSSQVRRLMDAARLNARDGFLECPIAEHAGLTEDVEREDASVPTSIGPFTVIRRLACGDASAVYLARQLSPARRFAAVKVLTNARVREDSQRRFAVEGEAVAMMQHPHVAQFFESGVSADGWLYFAMEYVDGLQIAEYCGFHALGPRDRLRLFLQVCEGVAHAHERGVIHRDLKPSNIMVAETPTGPGLAKVIDFGIAKVQARAQVEAVTQAGLVIGTLAYMSPEQLRGESASVTIQSDVFSLGLVLFEMLTGIRPFDAGAGLHGIAGFQDEFPLRALVNRHARTLGPDLASVILKASAARTAERYESVRRFAADIERVLRQEPVAARARTLPYVASRFIRRHRATCTAAMVALAAATGAVAYVWQARSERATLALQLSEAWLNEALSMGRSLGNPSTREPVVKRLLTEAEQLGRLFPDNPRALGMLAAAQTEFGYLLLGKNQPDDAMAYFRQALALRERLAGAWRSTPAARREVSLSLVRCGDAAIAAGDREQGVGLYAEALAIDNNLVRESPRDTAALANLGWSYERMTPHVGDAEAEHYRVLQREAFEEVLRDGESREAFLGLSSACNGLAMLLQRRGQPFMNEARAAADYAEGACRLAPADRFAVFARLRASITLAQAQPDLAGRISAVEMVLGPIKALVESDPRDRDAVTLWLHAIDRARQTVQFPSTDPAVADAQKRFDEVWAAAGPLRN